MIMRSLCVTLFALSAGVAVVGCDSGPSNGEDGGMDMDAMSDTGMADTGTNPDTGIDAGVDSGLDAGDDGSVNVVEDFATSFETGHALPNYESVAENDSNGVPLVDGVTGPVSEVLGDISNQIDVVTARGENLPGEGIARLVDGNFGSKWLDFTNNQSWVQFKMLAPAVMARYGIVSANDAQERDPKNWTISGSNNGTLWVELDSRTDIEFENRGELQIFEFANTTPYLYYRWDITSNWSPNGIIQVGEFIMSNGDSTPPGMTPMRTQLGKGANTGWNMRPDTGFTGVRALRYAGNIASTGRAYAYNKILDVNVLVTEDTELSYMVFPDAPTQFDRPYTSTYVSIDLAFSDGTYLSDLGAVDQYGIGMDPASQGDARMLFHSEWNRRVSHIGQVAAGKTISRILVGVERPPGNLVTFGGWLDDIAIIGHPVHVTPTHLSEYAVTTRGTNSSGGFSRGNNIPAACLPHGFNFMIPFTNANSMGTQYTYARDNNAQNLPTLQALGISHEPSIWMGDRHLFHVMPSSAVGVPNPSRSGRALAFRHENEIAHPHYYSVTFENGIRAEMTPTDHAGMMRFTFPGDTGSLLFDNAEEDTGDGNGSDDGSRVYLNPAMQEITGWTDGRGGFSVSAGATRMFFVAQFDKPVAQSGGGLSKLGYFSFALTPADRQVTMRIATSLISVAQARHNLSLEIAPTDTFDTVRDAAQAIWDDKLDVIEVEGGTHDQLTTLYSNLYRVFMYPNSAHENTGTAAAPVWEYASPFRPVGPFVNDLQTRSVRMPGQLYVNNGFWDTYHTAWPLLALLTPQKAGEMIDGFVQHFRDGGWISRWSSPGYADLMTGTSSDVAFADAYLKGVTNFDVTNAFRSALRNATVRPASGAVGRKGLEHSIFRGWTHINTDHGMSWALSGYQNDFGIANMATGLAAQNAGDPQLQAYYLGEAEYFRNRALNYVNMFDPAVGFFQGRQDNAMGTFRFAPASFDPRIWGYDYTETNAWNMAFDPIWDPQGLINLYGGAANLETKLDTFFITPEDATFVAGLQGSYGGVIHEMREARETRLGQLALANQVSYHIPYMYLTVGNPSKTQEVVRDVLRRLWVGSEIGQGMMGDEDNGALSSWNVFSSIGIYPLQVGSPSYVIGSPIFTKVTVHLENGNDIVINAPANSNENIYVQGLDVNGAPHPQTYISHATLVAGATLDFAMGPAASSWGTGAGNAPPSMTAGTSIATPMRDLAVGTAGSVVSSDATSASWINGLFDDNSLNHCEFATTNPTLIYTFATTSPTLQYYSLTSSPYGNNDPTGWTLWGSNTNDGTDWVELDTRTGTQAAFAWRRQTRAFPIAAGVRAPYKYYRFTFPGTVGGANTLYIAEIELMSTP